MRRNNWKKYIIILIAFIVGLVANLAARAILPRLLPAGMQAWTGLLATLLEIVISVGIILKNFIGAMREKGVRTVKRAVPAFFTAYCYFSMYVPVYAAKATGTSVITSGFNSLYEIVAAIVSSIGQLLLLWGVFEWATALNSQDGTMQSMAFKRIASGLVACLAPQIVTVISASLK